MTTNRLFNAFSALLTTVLLMTAGQSFAQTKHYATASTGSAYLTTPITGATDESLTTATRITTQRAAVFYNESYVELKFPAPLAADVTTYVKIDLQQNDQLQGLIGGAVGNLVNGVLGVVVGQQGITVEARDGTTTVALTPTSTFGSTRLRIVRDNATTPTYYLMVTPGAQYDRIKITNTVAGLIASRWMDVYGAFYVTDAPTCQAGAYTSYSATPTLVNLLGAGVTNPQNAIDGNPATGSRISLGTLAVGTYVEQTVYFEGASTNTDKYNLKLRLNPGLLNVNVLGGIRVIAYKGGTIVRNVQLNDVALGINLNLAVTTNQPLAFQFTPGAPIDRITVRFTALVDLGLNNYLELYEVVKGDFAASIATTGGTAVTGGVTALQNSAVTLTANTTGCNATGPYTYLWSNGATTQTIAAPTTTVGAIAYTVTITDAYGNSRTSAATTVTVLAPPVGGTLSSSQNLCTGDAAANIVLSGNTGDVVRWESSTSNTFAAGTIQTYTNTTSTLTSTEIGTVTATTYIRAVVGQNGYPVAYSSTAILNVKTSTWDGTSWSAGIPDSSTTIFITGNYTATQDLAGCSLTVSNNAVVNVPSGLTVTLNKFINVLSGSFTLANNAHLIQLTDAVNQGNITVNRNSSLLYRLDYTMWSTPVTGQQLGSFSPATSTTRFYEYIYAFDPALNANREQYALVDPTTNFESAKGYLIRMPNSLPTSGYNSGATSIVYNGAFTGVPNNGTITKALSTNGERYTAVGNPFPSPINVHAFFDTNQSVLNTTTGLYFWRKKNNSNATSYAVLTRDAYVYNHAFGGNPGEGSFGGQEWDTFFNVTTPSNQWVINPGQGFLVRTATGISSPVVTFNNAMRTGSIHNPQFFRTAQPETISRLWLDLEGANAFSQMALVYSNTATLGLDSGREGLYMSSGGSIALYTIADANNLTIQARPEFTPGDVVPVGFNVSEAGQYTIKLHRKDGIFDNGQTIFIKDNVAGLTRNITERDYTFTSEAGTFDNRFEIVYATSALGIDTPVLNADSVIVYKDGSVINVSTGTTQISDVRVYDIRGRKLYSKDGINATTTSISNLQAAKEVLIIEVNTVKGKVSKKIVY